MRGIECTKLLGFILFLSLSVPVVSQDNQSRPPPPPPEVMKTVDAIVGKWEGKMTAAIPGDVPETFPWFVDSIEVALGSGAACTMKGEASIGPLAQSCLLAYDPEGKAVHYMCLTSMGEVHDHKGQWTNERTIESEPLEGFMTGQPITETVTWKFPDPNTLNTTSVVASPNQEPMRFEFTGKRK